MTRYVLTVITRAKYNNYMHSVHETEDEAKAEQRELLKKLNNTVAASMEPFAQVGNHTVRLADVESSMVTTEGEAPGYGGVGIA